MIASQRVESNCANIMFIITINGTDKIIQTIHHNDAQNHKEINITNGDRFNLFHINFGSTMFHIKTCTQINHVEINING